MRLEQYTRTPFNLLRNASEDLRTNYYDLTPECATHFHATIFFKSSQL